MNKDALLEIGTEELPASFVPSGMRQLQAIAEKSLADQQIAFKSIHVYGTPRRLAICVAELTGHSSDQEKRILGPALDKSKDAAGQWSVAAMGFARKHGLKPADLIEENGRLCAVQKTKGVATRALLTELFPQWITKLEFPKTMVWEPTHFRFPRPIRWFTAMYGTDLVLFTLAGVRSGRWTLGLSIQSSKKVPVAQCGKYVGLLKNQCVLVDPAARREAIQKLSEQAAKRVHGQVLMREGLLNEVTYLVEHPVAIMGSFDPAYLTLPREVLVTCIEHHQKFFPIETSVTPAKAGAQDWIPASAGMTERRLLPNFIGIRNGVSVHQELVKEGYERVLAARLADARFFFNQDRKIPLASRVDALKGVTFQKDLGNLFDKKERIKGLLDAITQKLEWDEADRSKTLRAAELCKADLTTEMVGEFPELQGTMARLYAQAEGEDAAVAQALEQHYWPVTLSGTLPATAIGAVVSLADKIDTLAGDFAVGLIPTGSADPYGLRRAAVGVLRILEAQQWTLPLEWLIDQALTMLPKEVVTQRDKTRQDLLQFMRQRFAGVLAERGFQTDEIEAVLARIWIITETIQRLQAIHNVRSRPEFNSLSNSFKRALNIVRDAHPIGSVYASNDAEGGVRAELLKHAAEQELFNTFKNLRNQFSTQFQKGQYAEALQSMVVLGDPLDQFFKGVMVMDKDTELRDNRLALLSNIVRLFNDFADFSKLQNA